MADAAATASDESDPAREKLVGRSSEDLRRATRGSIRSAWRRAGLGNEHQTPPWRGLWSAMMPVAAAYGRGGMIAERNPGLVRYPIPKSSAAPGPAIFVGTHQGQRHRSQHPSRRARQKHEPATTGSRKGSRPKPL